MREITDLFEKWWADNQGLFPVGQTTKSSAWLGYLAGWVEGQEKFAADYEQRANGGR